MFFSSALARNNKLLDFQNYFTRSKFDVRNVSRSNKKNFTIFFPESVTGTSEATEDVHCQHLRQNKHTTFKFQQIFGREEKRFSLQKIDPKRETSNHALSFVFLTSLRPDMFLLHPIYDRDRCRFRFEAIRNCSFVKRHLAPSDVHMFLTGFYPMLNDSAQC